MFVLMCQFIECPAGTVDVLEAKMFEYFKVSTLKGMLSHFYPTMDKRVFSRFTVCVVEGMSV